MAVYAISDLHLSFLVDKPMTRFGQVWKDYEEKISNNWKQTVKNDDIVIIPGDISWGMSLNETKADFDFIDKLPGKKVLLRGNHDYYFSTKSKIEKFFKDNNFNTLSWIHNNLKEYDECIVCGTRGWGSTENNDSALDEKIILREKIRLEYALNLAVKRNDELKEAGKPPKKIILAIHFPPFIEEFQEVIQKYKDDIYVCIYGHLHGYGHLLVKEGIIDGVEYKMVGCDYTGFKLIKLI